MSRRHQRMRGLIAPYSSLHGGLDVDLLDIGQECKCSMLRLRSTGELFTQEVGGIYLTVRRRRTKIADFQAWICNGSLFTDCDVIKVHAMRHGVPIDFQVPRKEFGKGIWARTAFGPDSGVIVRKPRKLALAILLFTICHLQRGCVDTKHIHHN